MSRIFKIFIVFLWITSVLLVIIDPFSIIIVGIINIVFILIGGLNYLMFRKYDKISLEREFLLVSLGVACIGTFFYFNYRVNKIILNVSQREFVLIFNLPNESCIQYKSTIALPESGLLYICNKIEAFDDNSSVLINGIANDSAFVFKEVFYSGIYDREIGFIYGGRDYNKVISIKDSLISHYIENGVLKE